MKDFKEFLLRGNLVDVAVGIVIGIAFAALVSAFVADLVTPIIAGPAMPECLSEIPVAARRCAFCTTEFVPAT